MSDIILTGIPRAGTTFAAAVIDGLPDSVCLNEPGWQNPRAALDAEDFVQFLDNDFGKLRRLLLRGEAVPDRRALDGSATTNYYRSDAQGMMQESFAVQPFARAGLSPNFTLAIKHNGPYLAVLPELVAAERFKIIAIIRKPLPVIRSWRRLQLPISRGDLPNAKTVWPELRAITDSEMDLLEKQVRIYELMLARLLQYEKHITLIDYDELIKKPQSLADAVGKLPATLPVLRPAKAEEASEDDERIVEALEHYAVLAGRYWAER